MIFMEPPKEKRKIQQFVCGSPRRRSKEKQQEHFSTILYTRIAHEILSLFIERRCDDEIAKTNSMWGEYDLKNRRCPSEKVKLPKIRESSKTDTHAHVLFYRSWICYFWSGFISNKNKKKRNSKKNNPGDRRKTEKPENLKTRITTIKKCRNKSR